MTRQRGSAREGATGGVERVVRYTLVEEGDDARVGDRGRSGARSAATNGGGCRGAGYCSVKEAS